MAGNNNAKEIVLAFVDALNAEDFETARQYVSEGMAFDGVLGSRRGADAYFKDMEKIRLKFAVKKTFADGDDVCLLYDLATAGQTLFSCGWYHVKGGKINTLRVVFDPRPLLEPEMKN